MQPGKGPMILATLLSAGVGLSAVGVAAMAVLQPRPSWVMFGFEFVVLVAASLGLLIGRGRFKDGPALGLVCVAGTIAVGSLFGYLGGGRVLFGQDIRMLFLARVACALALSAVAGWVVLARDPRATIPPFLRGLALGLPVPIVIGAAWYSRGRLGNLPDMATALLAIALFCVVTVLLAASTQLVVKAFRIGIDRADGAEGRAGA